MTEQKEDIWLEIMAAMEERRQRGWETYGKPLTAEDGRCWFREMRFELLDAVAYAMAGEKLMEIMERRLADLQDKLTAARDEIALLKSQLKSATEGR